MGYLPIEEMNTMKLIGMTALVTLTFTEVYANHPGSPARSGTPNDSALRLLKEQARAAAAMPEQATHRRLGGCGISGHPENCPCKPRSRSVPRERAKPGRTVRPRSQSDPKGAGKTMADSTVATGWMSKGGAARRTVNLAVWGATGINKVMG